MWIDLDRTLRQGIFEAEAKRDEHVQLCRRGMGPDPELLVGQHCIPRAPRSEVIYALDVRNEFEKLLRCDRLRLKGNLFNQARRAVDSTSDNQLRVVVDCLGLSQR